MSGKVVSARKRSSTLSSALGVEAKKAKMTQAADLQEAQIALLRTQVAAENEVKIVLMRAEFDSIVAKNAADLVAVNAQHAAEVAQHAAEVVGLKAQNAIHENQVARQTGMFRAWGSLPPLSDPKLPSQLSYTALFLIRFFAAAELTALRIEQQATTVAFKWAHRPLSSIFSVSSRDTRNLMGHELETMINFVDSNTGIFRDSASVNIELIHENNELLY